MNFKQLVLEQITFEELARMGEEDNLKHWREHELPKMIGKEVCKLGPIGLGVNFKGPYTVIRVKKGEGVTVRTPDRGPVCFSTPRIYPVSYLTKVSLSPETRNTFNDIINEL